MSASFLKVFRTGQHEYRIRLSLRGICRRHRELGPFRAKQTSGTKPAAKLCSCLGRMAPIVDKRPTFQMFDLKASLHIKDYFLGRVDVQTH